MLFHPTILTLAATWCLWLASMAGWGLLLTHRRGSLVGRIWIGLVPITLSAMLLTLLIPAGSYAARVVMAVLLSVGLIVMASRCGRWMLWLVPTVIVGAIALATLASLTPGNYDTGLYHLGSISYAREGGTVIGLANLHDRFGFSSSMWPLSAALGIGFWDGGEYRLVNGLLILAVLLDLLARLRGGLGRSPGTYALSAGVVLLVGAVIQYPARLVASSAQDTATLVFILVSGAYLLDYLLIDRGRLSATVAIISAALAGAMRPLGWVFLCATFIVVAGTQVCLSHRRMWRVVWPGALVAGGLLTMTLIRDVLTSGWLLFPAQVGPLPVPWRVTDPESTARDISGWARTPFQDPTETLRSGEWFTGWLTRLPTDWSIPAVAFMLLVLIIWLCVSSAARAELTLHWRCIVLALLPALVTLAFWFISAPDPRFAWGVIVLVGIIPLAIAAPSVQRQWRWWCALAITSLMLVALAVARGSLSGSSWRLAPPITPVVTPGALVDGTRVVIPVDGDQCWSVFPMCRPWYAPTDVVLRGESWVQGFEPRP